MTVKELIEELQKYPLDTLVFTADSEYGDEECECVDLKEGPRKMRINGNMVTVDRYIRLM